MATFCTSTIGSWVFFTETVADLLLRIADLRVISKWFVATRLNLLFNSLFALHA